MSSAVASAQPQLIDRVQNIAINPITHDEQNSTGCEQRACLVCANRKLFCVLCQFISLSANMSSPAKKEDQQKLMIAGGVVAAIAIGAAGTTRHTHPTSVVLFCSDRLLSVR